MMACGLHQVTANPAATVDAIHEARGWRFAHAEEVDVAGLPDRHDHRRDVGAVAGEMESVSAPSSEATHSTAVLRRSA